MARRLRLPDGKPRRIVICDSYDLATSTPSGTIHTIYLDDSEDHPRSVEELHAFLVKDRAIPRGTSATVGAISSAIAVARANPTKAVWTSRRFSP